MPDKKVALLILDGWGIGEGSASDAIHAAQTPVMDELLKSQPNATLRTSGLDVGLPDGQMGNSEVGHLNIGAGRVVYQELVKINQAVQNGELASNSVLQEAFRYARENEKKVHFFGLLSNGCIHSSDAHLHTLLELAEKAGVQNYLVHAFTDGRDTDPKSGLGFIQTLIEKLRGTHGKVASVMGRYYAMDRDKRWERVKIAYDLLVNGAGESTNDILQTITTRYQQGETDEFLKPICIQGVDGKIEAGDVVVSFNYRTDRCREITEVLTQNDVPDFGMKRLPLYYVTMTRYDEKYRNVNVIFEQQDMAETLGEVLSLAGKTQLRIAETEKYPHVTFFFSGGREQAFDGESRIMIPSPKVATYDLMPEMSAPEIRDAVIQAIRSKQPDFICLNFANPDMVGHTGVYGAIVKAVETVDACLGEVLAVLQQYHYSAVIIADHGNADFALNSDGSPNTAHTINPVPVIVLDAGVKNLRSGKLADIAPSILHLMGIDIPEAMNGEILIN
ncbi:MAG: 2,3-bisphosphoglycerate-independent phosphoglycerate mutase [Bacteroidia bacterium]